MLIHLYYNSLIVAQHIYDLPFLSNQSQMRHLMNYHCTLHGVILDPKHDHSSSNGQQTAAEALPWFLSMDGRGYLDPFHFLRIQTKHLSQKTPAFLHSPYEYTIPLMTTHRAPTQRGGIFFPSAKRRIHFFSSWMLQVQISLRGKKWFFSFLPPKRCNSFPINALSCSDRGSGNMALQQCQNDLGLGIRISDQDLGLGIGIRNRD